GSTLSAEDLGTSSSVTLVEGGTGKMSFDEDVMDITSWTEAEGIVTIEMADGSVASGELAGGVLNLDVMGDGSMFILYAQAGADTSAYEMLTKEEYLAQQAEKTINNTAVGTLYKSLDREAGIHLNYSVHHDYLDSTQEKDSVGKGNNCYSVTTTHIDDIVSTGIVLFQEGKTYNLDPEAKTALLVTEMTTTALNNTAILIDPLYNAIFLAAVSEDVIEEPREKDGVTYNAVVVPTNENREECVFYFNEDGSLAFYLEGRYLGSDIGGSQYTVNVIDSTVDEAVFDISGYEIKTLD
ncbi:MAG: hypothetical protein J6N77_04210, partial [Lachnospiraceae bacterium]|nr:hypothetical protein [Lachnospiraceae bacterium]